MSVTPFQGEPRLPILLLADRRGSVGVLAAMMFTILMGLGAWSLNQAHLHYRGLLMRHTVQAASLAAASKLTTYYTSGGTSTAGVVNAAQAIATANMPTATYGTVVPASNVVLGNWNSTNATFTSLAESGGTIPNAVRITGAATTANGNPVSLLFSGVVGKATMDYTANAVASFGTSQTFNTIIVNDLSGSFSPSIGKQRDADKAILDCVRNSSGSLSKFGITGLTAHSTILQPLTQASTNLATITAKIDTIKSCGNTGMPACSGTNVASAIYSAIQQFSDPIYANTSKNMIVITDGVPNANSITYTREDGIYPTPTSPTPTCTNNCTDANLWTMAVNQAAAAKAAGISVSTIYYSGGTAKKDRAAYAAKLASLVGGTGIALVAPTTDSIALTFAGFCATMSSSLKAVY